MCNPWGYGEWTGEWSDNSPLWTEELKMSLGAKDEDDGEFFMPLEQYYKYYCATSITVETDKEKYSHSSYSYDFSTLPKGEFFQFEITRAIDLNQNQFCISVAQQGKRIQSYRLAKNKFEPSPFRMLLMKSDGEVVKGTMGGHENFLFSLIC